MFRSDGTCVALPSSVNTPPVEKGMHCMISERRRVIVALADAFEGALVYDALCSEGFEPLWRSTPYDAADEMRTHPWDLLIADASFMSRGGLQSDGRSRNPLTPCILIGDDKRQCGSGRAMYLARPVDRAMLTCFVAMAFHQETPIRRSMRKRVDPVQAMVNGLPSYIVDMSAEGLRLEIPNGRRSVLPPVFSVRVDIINLSMTVQRMWTQPMSKRAGAVWCGAALSENRVSVENRWRLFVDTVPVVGTGSVAAVL